jgi:hypothetical protein
MRNLHIREIKATIRAFYFSFFPSPISVQRYKKISGKRNSGVFFPRRYSGTKFDKNKISSSGGMKMYRPDATGRLERYDGFQISVVRFYRGI